ncbi:uncharacterized protein [Amphiura filiformis]|uniref:uncharacterized protein isoform X2 n=1 Tax=Amphiura filiformis TaxID=82378 RepID=UPI003B21BCD6
MMEYFELVRTAFIVVGFLLAMSRDRVTWMTVDLIASVVMGAAWVFIPQIVLGFHTEGELNGIHLFLGRVFGVVMLCGAVKMYLNYRSHDSYAQVMLLASRIVSTSILLIVLAHSVYGDRLAGKVEEAPPKPKEGEKPAPTPAKGVVFNDQWRSLNMTAVICALLGNVVWFLKSRHYGGHTSLDSLLNIHLRVDFFVTLIAGVVWLAYTPTILGFKMGVTAPDTVQVHFGQVLGAMLIGDAILSAVAPGFLFEEDKRNVLLGRVVNLIGALLITLHAIITYDEYTEQHPWVMGIGFAIISAVTVHGYHAPHETSTYKTRRYGKGND